MVVRDPDGVGVRLFPYKTDPPLVANPNAVLAGPIAFQGLQAVPGRRQQVLQNVRLIQIQELPARGPLDVRGKLT